MKRCFRQTLVLFLAALLAASLLLPAFAADEMQQLGDEATANVTAAILYDETNDVVLYEKDADKHVQIGSITKVLNACAAVKYMDADFPIRAAGELSYVKPYASRAPISYGERYTFEQLLHAMLIPSGCDAAYVIADMTGRMAAGGRDSGLSSWAALQGGVAEMNKVLEELDCRDSHFVNPDGQDEDGQYTTCRDFLKVLRHAMTNPLIRTVVGKYDYRCTDLNGNEHYWTTTNRMINPNSDWYYAGTKGIKTGSAIAAGYCMALEVERDGRTLISLVVGADGDNARCTATKKLMDAGFSQPAPIKEPEPTPPNTTPPTTPVNPTGERPKGDIDNDMAVTPADARLTLRISIYLEDPAQFDLRYAEMDNDGYITPADARLVLRLAVGLES